MAQTQIFRGRARAIVRNGNATQYIYHSTPIVTVDDNGTITLNTGGWRSNTTRTAMNQASNNFDLGFRVFQRDFAWFATWQGQTIPFHGETLVLTKG